MSKLAKNLAKSVLCSFRAELEVDPKIFSYFLFQIRIPHLKKHNISRMRTTYHHQKKTLDGNHDGGDLPWATGIPFSTVTKR